MSVCVCVSFYGEKGVPPMKAKAPSQNVICPNNTNVITYN